MSRGAAVSGRGFSRRGFLAATGAGVAAMLLVDPRAIARADATGRLRFAMIADTQLQVENPARTEWTARVYAAIAARRPAFVGHVGDLVQHGSDEEYEAYLGTIPHGLRPLLRHVPGNHEVRWDEHAGERYTELFGRTPYSFDVGGLHVVGLNPTRLLQEPGYFTDTDLRWLEHDLRKTHNPTTALIHFPVGSDNYYVHNQDRLLELLARHDVRVLFAGHTHTQRVEAFNGLTQVTMDGTINTPCYYWCERIRHDDGSAALVISRVQVGEDSVEEREVTRVPLTGARPAERAEPRQVSVTGPRAGVLRVRAATPIGGATGASVQLYAQHAYGRKQSEPWQALSARGRHPRFFDGSLDVSALPPGEHRLRVRTTTGNGTWHERTERFTVPGGRTVRWSAQLDAPVQASLTAHEDLVVAATISGTVTAIDVNGRRRWTVRTGPVYGRPAITADGATVLVVDTDHRLRALSAESGRERWTYDTGAPGLGSPLLADIDDEPVVLVGAGRALHAVALADGRRRWVTDLGNMVAGQPACDGEFVYIGAGDGNAHALDARTGQQRWATSVTAVTGPYRRRIYGPWCAVIDLLPDASVLVPTIGNASVLDRATGAVRRTISGTYLFSPKLLLPGEPDGLLLVDEWGVATRVNPSTGEQRWTTETGVRFTNYDAVVHGRTLWGQAATGQLVALDVDTGELRERQELTTSYVTCAPVLVGDTVVTGAQDGVLRAVNVG
jgi:outer membrane protein assembly factor BamB